jgi:cellulose synthase/poly-beta-1,6-N-acetylglucosamine synthase-like glycosyltransferase
MTELTIIIQSLFLLYFIALNVGYTLLNLISFFSIGRYVHGRVLTRLPQIYTGFEPKISVLVPAYNEEANIAASIRSLLQLDYPDYEVVVINDGSKDKTLDVLREEFALQEFPEAFLVRLQTKPVRGLYRSLVHPQLRVIDKVNGGKADALNAGINGARYPLFCGVDADSILQQDSLRLVARPFLEDPSTVACGGTIRIANGCQMSGGALVRAGVPSSYLALCQTVEYLRAFLFGRAGWSPLNALLIISGAFGLFDKEVVVQVGGYRTDSIGEDMELVVRLHRILRQRRQPYRIAFVPDPVCWTEAPEDLQTLKNQRVRWQRGLSDSLYMNRSLLFSRGGGAVGWIAFPFIILFEWLSPIVEAGGYVFFVIAYLMGSTSFIFAILFLMIAFLCGTLLSISALFLEEAEFHTYPKSRHVLVLLVATIAENFGYRQLNALWRLNGLRKWMFGTTVTWGEMKRTASLQEKPQGVQ